MNSKSLEKAAEWFLRLALAAAFFSAVADRFGLWGPAGTPNVAWGNWQNFQNYCAKLNAMFPAVFQPALAWFATFAEMGLGIGLLLPVSTRWIALGSGVLLTLFAVSMTLVLGIKAPLNYSVFTAAAGAFLLAASKAPRR